MGRYVLAGLLILFLAIWGAHRLIIVWVVGKVIARENLAAQYELSGNLLTNIQIKHLLVTPTGQADVQRISIEELRLTYDLRKLWKHRLPDVIKSAYIRDAYVELTPVRPEERKKPRKPREFAVDWNDLFEQPVLFADQLEASNFNLISHESDGDMIIERAAVKAAPGVPGELTAARWVIPNFSDWHNLHAIFTNHGDEVTIQDLRLDDRFTIQRAAINAASRKLELQAQIFGGQVTGTLTQKPQETGSADGDFAFTGLKLPDSSEGTMDAKGDFAIAPKDMVVNLSGSAQGLSRPDLRAELLTFRGKLSRRLLPKPVDAFDGLQVELRTEGQNIEIQKYAVDHVASSFSLNGTALTLHSFDLTRGPNKVSASGYSQLPSKDADWTKAPFHIRFEINAPQLAAFATEPNLQNPNGSLSGAGELVHENDVYHGSADLTASDLVWQEFHAGTLNAHIKLENTDLVLDRAELVISETERLTAEARVNLQDTRRYEGKLNASLHDLHTFQPLLAVFGRTDELSGSIELAWQGAGPEHHGELNFAGQNVQFGNILVNSAKLSGSYTPKTAQFPNIRAVSRDTSVRADASWDQPEAALRNIEIRQKNATVATGSLSFPLDLSNGPKFPEAIPEQGPIGADFQAKDLDLEKLFADFGVPPSVAGKVSLHATVTGNIQEPVAQVDVHATGLRSGTTSKFQPTGLDALVSVTKQAVRLDATVKQPEVQPMKINGQASLDLNRILRDKTLPEDTPIEARLVLPKSSVGFVQKFVPDIRFIQGDLSAEVTAKGTVGAPVLNGDLTLNLPGLRFSDPAYPAVNNAVANLHWAGNKADITKLTGNVSGGTFTAKGSVLFPKLTEPVFDVSLTTDNVLVTRNDTLTVRANSDLRLKGPLASAAITGKVGITKSRFMKEIEIIPIELPGKPAPKPPPTQPGFSLPAPPFRDWTFDVAVTTADPFLVRGNLASGSVTIDTHLIGTGAKPTLTGQARMENFTATLPFSTLQITNGLLYFSPETPFVPYLDLQGISSLRNYVIHVYVYGTPDDPKSVFTSEPPLPQEDIISLLATGATNADLTSSSDALAGRAAVLAAESLSKKIFKRTPTQFLPFADRLNLDIGSIDQRTGNQEVSTRFQLSPHLFVTGELDVQGNVRVQLRYLIRFK